MVWPLKKSRRESPNSVESFTRRQRSIFGSMKKRRNAPPDDTVTEVTDSSFTSEMSNSAPWRVENIRSMAPQSDDWWTEESANDSREGSDGEGFEAMVVAASSASSSSSDTRRFHNCGLETWLKAREEWNRRTVEILPSKPTPVEYNQLVRGLVKHISERTYELPRKMALSDLIDVYNDIWDGQSL